MTAALVTAVALRDIQRAAWMEEWKPDKQRPAKLEAAARETHPDALRGGGVSVVNQCINRRPSELQ